MADDMRTATELTRAVLRSPDLTGVLYRPDGPGTHPGVVVLGGSDGGAPEAAAAGLARSGFAALALAYFGVPGLPRHPREIPVEYCVDAAGWLARQRAISGSRVGIVGRSRGTELALLAAAHGAEVVAGVVGYASSNVVWQAPPTDPSGPEPPASSWSLAGDPVPFAPTGPVRPDEVVHGRVRFRPVFERALCRAPADAAIPVERIDGPLLMVSGGHDRMWPSREMAERVLDRRARQALPYTDRHLHFPDAGHLIGVPGTGRTSAAGPIMSRLDTGGTPDADERASRDAWPAVTGFLADLLDEPRLSNSRR